MHTDPSVNFCCVQVFVRYGFIRYRRRKFLLVCPVVHCVRTKCLTGLFLHGTVWVSLVVLDTFMHDKQSSPFDWKVDFAMTGSFGSVHH